MSKKFIVEGGLEIPSGKNMSLFGTADAINALSTNVEQNSAKSLVTEQAIKSYVDTKVTGSDLDLMVGTTDGLDLALETEKLKFLGTASEVEVSHTDADNVMTITYGLPAAVTLTTSVQAGTATMAAGSITDSSGAISLGNENLSTTGTLGAGVATLATASTIGNLTLGNGSIVDSSGAISFGDDNLVTTGTLGAGVATLATASKIGNLTLGNGSIVDSSGNISFGDENLSWTGTAATGALTVTGAISDSAASTFTSGAAIGNVTISDGSIIDASGDISFGDDNLVTTGTLGAAAGTFTGDMSMQANVTLGNATGDQVIFSGRISSNIDPDSLANSRKLGSSNLRWSEVHSNAAVMEFSKYDDFNCTPTNSKVTAFTFADNVYSGVKFSLQATDGTNVTCKEVLIASDMTNASVVEYATVNTGTEIDVDVSAATTSNTCTVSVSGSTATGCKGAYTLVAKT